MKNRAGEAGPTTFTRLVGPEISSHSDVKIKKSNSECKMSKRNAVFQFGMQNVKAVFDSECKMSRRNAVFQFGMQNVKA